MVRNDGASLVDVRLNFLILEIFRTVALVFRVIMLHGRHVRAMEVRALARHQFIFPWWYRGKVRAKR